jgi:hypothetical protein
MWDFSKSTSPQKISNTVGVRVTSLALSANESFLLAGDSNGCIHVSSVTSVDLSKVIMMEMLMGRPQEYRCSHVVPNILY